MKKAVVFLCMILMVLTVSAKKKRVHIESRGLKRTVQVSGNYDGIDVSKYQGEIDWMAIADNRKVKFAYIKATEGATHVDPNFEKNIAGARQRGVRVGCYHFLRSSSSIADQFANFTSYVKREEQDLIPLIDVETIGSWTPRQLVDSLHTFAVMLYEYYGCVPMIYTSAVFYNKYLANKFTNYPLFIARYAEGEPSINDGTAYTLWQYSAHGRVPGIKGDVDLSRFGENFSVLDILAYGQHLKNKQGKVLEAVDVIKPEGIPMLTPNKFKTSVDAKRDKEAEKEKAKLDKELKKLQEKERKEAEKLAKKKAKEEAAERKRLEKEEAKRLKQLKKEEEQRVKREKEQDKQKPVEAEQEKAEQTQPKQVKQEKTAVPDELKYSTRKRKKTTENNEN